MNKKTRLIALVAVAVLSYEIEAQQQTAQAYPEGTKTKVTEGRITEAPLRPLVETEDKWNLFFYGFVKADYVYSDAAALSYGQENLNAPNQAKRVVQRDDMQARSNIQLNDTRLGFKSKFGEDIIGVIELDFINFAQSSPNVNTRPRLRQAYVQWDFTPQWQFFMGQKWDIYSPLNMDTYNTINAGFYLGNHGWMREQVGLAYKIDSDTTLTVALGNSGINADAPPSQRLELSRSPSVAFQLKYKATNQDTFYLSGITANKLYRDPELMADPNRALYYDGFAGTDFPGTPIPPFMPCNRTGQMATGQCSPSSPISPEIGKSTKVRRAASGLSLGHEHVAGPGGKFRFKWEANYGQNIGDTFALGISNANVAPTSRFINESALGVLRGTNVTAIRNYVNPQVQVRSIREMSGYVSGAYKFDPKWEFGAFIGATKILNPDDLPASNVANIRSLEIVDPAAGWGAPGSPGNGMGAVREASTFGSNLTFFAYTGLRLFVQHEYIVNFYKDAERNRGILNHIDNINVDTGVVTLRNVGWSHERSSARADVNIYRFGAIYTF